MTDALALRRHILDSMTGNSAFTWEAAERRLDALVDAKTAALRAEVERLRAQMSGFLGWADVRTKHGMIFPEELDVRMDEFRALLAAPEVKP